ncbi:peptidoglycan-associated lipoprotein Pal [Thermodesulfovibrio hydrogeniphilus]
MRLKHYFIFLFCLLFIVSCTERKVYMPTGKESTDITQMQDKSEQEKLKTEEKLTDEDMVKSSKMAEIIKRLQEEIGDIYFDFDKYDIRQDAIQTLKKVSSALQKYPNLRLIIEGHCDERGTTEYNFALGQKRANAAKQYLISLGIQSARIDIVSYGKEKPVCTESNETCWQKNRRAHFVFIEEGK